MRPDEVPGRPHWFRRTDRSWYAVLAIAHPEHAVRERAWALLQDKIDDIARELSKYWGTTTRIRSIAGGRILGVSVTDDVLRTMSGLLCDGPLRYRWEVSWRALMSDLEIAMQVPVEPDAGEDQAGVTAAAVQRVREALPDAKTYNPLVAHVEPWLKVVMKNLYVTASRPEWREDARRARVSIDGGSSEADSPQVYLESNGPRPESSMITAETLDGVISVLTDLPVERRFRVRFFLLMSCSWEIWRRLPDVFQNLLPEERAAMGVGDAEDFPPQRWFDYEPGQRQRNMEQRLLAAEKQGSGVADAADVERQIKERVQKWKTGGRQYLLSEIRCRAPHLEDHDHG